MCMTQSATEPGTLSQTYCRYCPCSSPLKTLKVGIIHPFYRHEKQGLETLRTYLRLTKQLLAHLDFNRFYSKTDTDNLDIYIKGRSHEQCLHFYRKELRKIYYFIFTFIFLGIFQRKHLEYINSLLVVKVLPSLFNASLNNLSREKCQPLLQKCPKTQIQGTQKEAQTTLHILLFPAHTLKKQEMSLNQVLRATLVSLCSQRQMMSVK